MRYHSRFASRKAGGVTPKPEALAENLAAIHPWRRQRKSALAKGKA